MALEYNSKSEDAIAYCDGPALDGCYGQVELAGSFMSVLEQLKTMSWKAVNSAGEWLHYCPACKQIR